ncbi:MAG: fibronectin type III domain-containing protein [Bacteroidota bacterium]
MKNALLLCLILFVHIGYGQIQQLTNFEIGKLKTGTLTFSNQKLFFQSEDSENGDGLFVYNLSTDSLSFVKDINPTGDDGITAASAFEDGILFRATSTGLGAELWFSNGTEVGTYLVKDINPTGSSFPEEIIEFNNIALFLANDGTNGKELWKTDGTEVGTQLVLDIAPGSEDGTPANTGIIYGKNTDYVFFRADNGTNGFELYITDGTILGTRLVEDLFAGSGSGMGETTPVHAAIYKNTLYFRGNDGGVAVGKELHYFDTTDETIKLVKEINPGASQQADVKNLFAVGDKLFFRAKQGNEGVEPYLSDGTEVGTVKISDLNPNGGSNPVYQLGDTSKGRVFFRANPQGGNEPWVSDGTTSGTYRIIDLITNGASNPTFIGFLDGYAYFSANTNNTSPFGNLGNELFATDGTQVFLVDDFNTGSLSSNPSNNALVIDNKLYFSLNNDGTGSNLYVLEPANFININPIEDFAGIAVRTVSIPKSFQLQLSDLTDTITISPPDGFQISTSETNGFTQIPLKLSPNASGSIDQTIYVRFSPILNIAYEEDILVEGVDVFTGQIKVTGEGLTPEPKALLVFDTFSESDLPEGWIEEGSNGLVTIVNDKLEISYDPSQPERATAKRSFDATSGTIYFGFTLNTDRQTMNAPVSIKNASENVVARIDFRNGIELVTGLDSAGNATSTVNFTDRSDIVVRDFDHLILLKIDTDQNTMSLSVNGFERPEGQNVPLLNSTANVASFEVDLPFLFDIGRVQIDEVLIGRVNKWDLRRLLLEVSSLASSVEAGNEPGKYPQTAVDNFFNEISAATTIFIDAETQNDIDLGFENLFNAFQTFKNSIIKSLATVIIDPTNGHKLRNGLFGYNNRSVDQAWSYRNPEFIEALKAGKAGWMRYLSGTISDPFNMNTGEYELEWIEQFRRVNNQVKAYERLEVKGPQLVYDLYQALGEAGAKLIVTWPGFMAGPTEAEVFAKFCKDNNIIVEYWQLNNEPYFFMPNRNHWFYNNGTDYAVKMEAIDAAIKKGYDGALTAPNASWGVNFNSGFSAEFSNYEPQYYDALSYHSYASFNNQSPPPDLAIRNANAGMKIGGSDAPQKARDVYGADKRYFITEFNVFNNTLAGSYYSGMYNAEFLMRNTAFDNMDYLGLHVFNVNVVRPIFNHNSLLDNAFATGTEVDADTIEYGINIPTQGEVILLAVEALNNSNFSIETEVIGGEIVLAEHPNSLVSEIPALFARAYTGSNNKDYILISNKSSIPHEITLQGITFPEEVLVTSINSDEPLVVDGIVPTQTTMNLSNGKIVLAGYSLTRLEWQVDVRKPKQNRIFKSELTSSGVLLKWWKDENADGYRIRMGNSKNNLTEMIEVVGSENNEYHLPLSYGRQIYIVVSAYNEAGESENSNLINIKYERPHRPKLVRLRPKDGRVTLLWESVPNANGYKVYYGTDRNRLTEEVDARNTSGFTVKGLENGQRYFFGVRAYNGSGISDISQVMDATPETNLPFAPYDLRGGEASNEMVDLTWTETTFTNQATFNIYRSEKPWSGYELVVSNVSGTTYTDNSSMEIGTYYYIIKAENEAGESFYPSNILTVEKSQQINGSQQRLGARLSLEDEQFLQNRVLIRKNPVENQIDLIIPSEVKILAYRIYDSQGKRVKSKKEVNGRSKMIIPFTANNQGLYLVELDTNVGKQILKFLN